MKIVYVHHCGSTGGAGNSLFFLLSKLISTHEVHIITQKGPMASRFKELTHHVYEIEGIPMAFSAEGFSTLRIAFANIKSLRFNSEIRKVCDILHHIEPDLVHLNEIGMFSLAKRIKLNFKIPIIMHARTVPNRRNRLLIKYFTEQCNQYIDHLVCISKSVSNLLPSVKSKSVLYNPIHLNTNDTIGIGEIDYEQQPLRILFLANFYKQKGVEEIMNAAIKLRDNQMIKFIIVGSNTRSEAFFKSLIGRMVGLFNLYPNYERKFKDAIKRHGLKNIQLLGQVNDVKDVITSCQLLIAPMHLNGTPRSVFEAGVYGIPTILSLYHKIDDLVEDGKNGFVISEKNTDQLVERILQIESDRSLLKRFGTMAKEKYLEICNQDYVAKQMLEIYSTYSLAK